MSLEAPEINIPGHVYPACPPRPSSSSLRGFFWAFTQKIHWDPGLVGWVCVGLRAFCSWKVWGGGLDLCWEQGAQYRNISVAAQQSLGPWPFPVELFQCPAILWEEPSPDTQPNPPSYNWEHPPDSLPGPALFPLEKKNQRRETSFSPRASHPFPSDFKRQNKQVFYVNVDIRNKKIEQQTSNSFFIGNSASSGTAADESSSYKLIYHKVLPKELIVSNAKSKTKD